jgi:DNA-binding NtrC family response regulator
MPQTPDPAQILIVDDDADVLTAGRLLLKQSFAGVETTRRPDDLPRLLAANAFDVILLDMNYARGATSGEEGFRWLTYVLERDPDAVVVVITAHAGVQIAVEALKRGATDFIAKPWSNERLAATVKTGVQLRRSRREAGTLKLQNETLVAGSAGPPHPFLGNSPAIKHVLSVIARTAPTDANVLILGENGTGKELVAREVHRQSRRAAQPFMAVDLGSVTETLFESELFGHKKGAFTDAKADRIGRFQSADGGTLFLDEVGNLPLRLQPKLLTALEQRRITPVGANQPVPVDVRVVSATNLRPERINDETILRQDLLYRLNTVELRLPSLRERVEDIPILLDYFLGVYAKRYGKETKPIAPAAMAALCAYPWPGNVRALRHAAERAVILSEGAEFRAGDFSLPETSEPALPPANTENLSAELLNLDAVEKRVIERALRKHRWNISHAAKELGLTRASLYRRMEKHGL